MTISASSVPSTVPSACSTDTVTLSTPSSGPEHCSTGPRSVHDASTSGVPVSDAPAYVAVHLNSAADGEQPPSRASSEGAVPSSANSGASMTTPTSSICPSQS